MLQCDSEKFPQHSFFFFLIGPDLSIFLSIWWVIFWLILIRGMCPGAWGWGDSYSLWVPVWLQFCIQQAEQETAFVYSTESPFTQGKGQRIPRKRYKANQCTTLTHPQFCLPKFYIWHKIKALSVSLYVTISPYIAWPLPDVTVVRDLGDGGVCVYVGTILKLVS